MFHTFFPRPKLLVITAILWTAACIAFWYIYWKNVGAGYGFPPMDEENKPVGLSYFVTPDSIWFYGYFLVAIGIFCGTWHAYAKDCIWRGWSLWGTALLLIITNFGVDISLAINNWRRPFFDKVQQALSTLHVQTVPEHDFFELILVFFQIASIAVAVGVLLRFFVSHYLFRWRTALSSYYLSRWLELRHIEGSSQRVQEDTRDFANYAEDLGVSFVTAFMTLVAFLPLLYQLEKYVTELPIVGAIPHPLVTASIFWAVFGTVLLWIFGIRLPGLEFKNQRVEAAFRKELVYGEDDANRAQPMTVTELYSNVRKNYFTLYFNYLYFNVARNFYLQTDQIYGYFILIPSLSAAVFTFGTMQQILSAFGEVSNSFQYLINSWNDIIKLQSIYKRLKAFEASIENQPLPTLDREYLESQIDDMS